MVVLVPSNAVCVHCILFQPNQQLSFIPVIIVLPSVELNIVSCIANYSVRFSAVILPVEPNPKGFKMLASLAAPFKRAFNHDPEKANALPANDPASSTAAMPTRVLLI